MHIILRLHNFSLFIFIISICFEEFLKFGKIIGAMVPQLVAILVQFDLALGTKG